MQKYTLIGYSSGKLGVIECASLNEAGIFLATNFPDEYFGANITCENGDFSAIAVREYYGGNVPTPIEAALSSMITNIKINSALCDEKEDRKGVLKVPYKKIISKEEKLVKG